MNDIGLTFQYYRLLLVYNLLFSAFVLFLFVLDNNFNSSILLASKTIGFGCATGLYHYAQGKTYFYFRNAGLAIRRLILQAWAVDFAITIFLIVLLNLVQHVIGYFKG